MSRSHSLCAKCLANDILPAQQLELTFAISISWSELFNLTYYGIVMVSTYCNEVSSLSLRSKGLPLSQIKLMRQ